MSWCRWSCASYLEAAVFHALLEAEASEQAARMTAMDSATNNATKMISRYTLEMNRARQSQISVSYGHRRRRRGAARRPPSGGLGSLKTEISPTNQDNRKP